MSDDLDLSTLALTDEHPSEEDIRADILRGLSAPQKRLPSKYFYDECGSMLFEAICELPEYYVARTELTIMKTHAADMARRLGPDVLLVELGSGSSVKTRLLLDHLERPVGYVPVDISREHLQRTAEAINAYYAALQVLPVCADFTRPFTLPTPAREPQRIAVYFPGSTLGNFEPPAAARLLRRIAALVGPGGALLLGADLEKDVDVLERAYDDEDGVTAQFNLNILARLNRELEADFDLSRFRHGAFYNAAESRIEMHLVSLTDQVVQVAGRAFALREGETIHTENSYKYTPEDMLALTGTADFRVERVWMDAARYFSVQYLAVASAQKSGVRGIAREAGCGVEGIALSARIIAD